MDLIFDRECPFVVLYLTQFSIIIFILSSLMKCVKLTIDGIVVAKLATWWYTLVLMSHLMVYFDTKVPPGSKFEYVLNYNAPSSGIN